MCHISMVFIPIPFKPQKGTPTMVTPSTYQSSTDSSKGFTTDLRPYFTQIIGDNSVNVHRIPIKVGTEIRLNEPFTCAKLQPDPSMHLCFMVDFAKCAK